MATKQEDLLEGITSKTTKSELMERLKKAARIVRGHQEQQIARLQEIEDNVRAKWESRAGDKQLRSVIVSSPDDEWEEAYEFLSDLKDVLPPALARMHLGVRTALGKEDEAQT